ncbi:hypothetical protein PHMEG_00041439, partial [Phytophthora megakarya]
MGNGPNEEDQFSFVEDVQLSLFDENLLRFHDFFVEEQTEQTRALIVGELSDLKKLRNKTVRKYTRQFRGLLRMLPFADEYDPIADTDLVRMYKDGLPIHWQLEINRLYRTWDLNGMILQWEIIERNEREEEMWRGRQRGQANKNKPGRASAQNGARTPEKHCIV